MAYPVPIRTTDGDPDGGDLSINPMRSRVSIDVERIVGHVVGQSDTVGVGAVGVDVQYFAVVESSKDVKLGGSRNNVRRESQGLPYYSNAKV